MQDGNLRIGSDNPETIPLILLKERRDENGEADPYSAIFRKAEGFNIFHLPVLEYQLRNLDLLRQAFEKGSYSGLIFTSQRAVEAWNAVTRESALTQPTATPWCDVQHYVVGELTEKALKSASTTHSPPSRNVLGANSGNGSNLADFIGQNHPRTGLPLLYLIGDKTKDTIAKKLALADIGLEELQVYETKTRSVFEEEFRATVHTAVSSQPQKMWLAFFSPSGINASMPIIKDLEKSNGHLLRLACIGSVTSDHLKAAYNRTADAVAASPNPESLLQAINAACK